VSDKKLETLHHVMSEMNKLKHQSSHLLSLLPEMTKIVSGNKLLQDIFCWLSSPDPWKNYSIVHGLQHSKTRAWFIHGNMLLEALVPTMSELFTSSASGTLHEVFCVSHFVAQKET
jgi:hypothetical protein